MVAGYFFNLLKFNTVYTVLHIIKLAQFPVNFEFRFGSDNFTFCHYFNITCVVKFKSVVHSLKTGLTGLQTVYNAFIDITIKAKTIRNGCGSVTVIFSIY